ncbi:MAG: tRNA uridine-5-carboxymethylaminomethyl(34) synthesis GTPase MnmE [Acidobacteria bacterium]|nr:tRNA uridine-5-carboxymethylaminomethyl(34) synthesis GTPase MnmE [Acidobacteriota bacterium]
MFSVDDTIVAIATPMGRGGLGIVRISGPRASSVAAILIGRALPLVPRHATLATLTSVALAASPTDLRPPGDRRPQGSSPSQQVRDQVVVTFFPGPQSYTGDDVAELSAHGSPVVLQGILRAAMTAGARLAEPGEFTLRAFLNGKLDLIQAEAVRDLIEAVTPLQARAAFDQLEGTLTTTIGEIESKLFDLMARLEASLDFPDEGYHFVQREAASQEIAALAQSLDALSANASRGRLIREGAQIAIIGTPNVGKSSLFNALLHANRAIVTPVPGTTRDLLTERADIGGLAIALVDTAGIRETVDVVEQEGVSRARKAISVADLTLLVLDQSRPLSEQDRALIDGTSSRRRVLVVNKVDLAPAWTPDDLPGLHTVEVSVTAGVGFGSLVDAMTTALAAAPDDRDEPLVTNVRHIALLERARTALGRAHDALLESNHEISEEFLLADLQDAALHLQEITGRRTTDDLLAHIFQNFCIGK